MSPDLPRVTIVIPSFNQAQYLEAALRSVLEQAYPNLEVMVFDGGSTDGSRDILEAFADRLDFWRSEPDDGQAAALREGFEKATGDVLAWLNSDDLLAPGALTAVADAWLQHGGDLMVAGACQVFDGSGPTQRHVASFQSTFGSPQTLPVRQILDLARHWFPGEFFYQPEVFFPRSAYEVVGGVDPSYYYTMDYDLWVRFALSGTPIVVLDRTLAWFREHDAQKTTNRAALHREMARTANHYLDQVEMDSRERARLKRWNERAVNPLVRETFKLLHRAGGW
jgi:glycosyltransferase involved in cell wall biosynthesis